MDHKTLAKLITQIENNPELAPEIVGRFPEHQSKVIGFTGSPGVGKSSLIDRVIRWIRNKDLSVAVVAIDPSSPFSKGAFLGDRIRMRDHFVDEKVFIRSMASRGALGGLCDAVFDVVNLLEASGFDYVLVETVGVGQSEVEISNLADLTVLVLSPGLGDDVQMLKAGVMEIADLYVVNKSDLPESDTLYTQLLAFISLAGKSEEQLCKTSSHTLDGVQELVEKIEKLWQFFHDNGTLRHRRKKRTQHHAEHILRKMIQQVMYSIGDYQVEDPYEFVELALSKLCKIHSKNGQGGGI
ncbi:methylmalonyl Co-A mutase-associated GTPase MeaB [Thermotoga profunda]|uniref:methylmalonyl Co-A mutase-associated GTPase MeaB n=1 Tax=Thermotoga profunda TaxID=1508420 RepID=UPI0009E24C45|nr:methylmalonyl Co-A mutase-associated GTPase MeaB [Thermotoga profunda]